MQRKIPSTKHKLHSIPINKMKNVKSNVLYRIPGGCVVALFVGIFMPKICFAADPVVRLSLSNDNMGSMATSPGETTTVSTEVEVVVDNAADYSLILSVEKENLTNGKTTIIAGNPDDESKSNVWGYKWDADANYTAPTTSGSNVKNLPQLDGNGHVEFTKNLTFGAKFANDAESGHYTNTGTLSLLATPRAVTTAVWTLADGAMGPDSGIVTMQEMTPSICNMVDTPTAIKVIDQTKVPTLLLRDSRDEQEYEIAKYPDGRCWMMSNLLLQGSKVLTKDDSNVVADWTLKAPISPIDGHFNTSNYYNAESYFSGGFMYYSWSDATAGAGTNSSITSGSVETSVCPKGWSLPTGGDSGEFYTLVNVALDNPTDANHAKIFSGSPYNFVASGQSGAIPDNDSVISRYQWWSRTAISSTQAYSLAATARGGVTNNSSGRYAGYLVRCIALK